MQSQDQLNILVFLGSVRTSTPPRPARLGERVAHYCCESLTAMGHEAQLVDPLDVDVGRPSGSQAFKPHFSYAKGRAPEDLDRLAKKIEAAEAYVMVSPEYNHSMSPALADLLNHFGSSLFSYKPSTIVTYSAGQWGGARAAVNMRTFLSELGCLPVSAMVHFPKAQDVLTEHGQVAPDHDAASWDSYCARSWKQLEWWGIAARNHRRHSDPARVAAPFLSSPEQRNAGS